LAGVAAELQRICRAAVSGLGLLGAAVHVMPQSGVSGIGASSDAHAAILAELLTTTGEGPGADAFSMRRPVLVPDLLASSGRWPGYVEAAARAGLGAVWSLPLHLGAVSLGILDLYDVDARSLSAEDLGVAVQLSRLAVEPLLDGRSGGHGGSVDAGLAAVEHFAEVHQAQGMVMVDLKVELAEALVRMRAHAFANEMTLVELARAIVGGTEDAVSWDR